MGLPPHAWRTLAAQANASQPIGPPCMRGECYYLHESAPPPWRRKARKEPQLTHALSWGFGGAACGNRTHDLFITSEALYRLS